MDSLDTIDLLGWSKARVLAIALIFMLLLVPAIALARSLKTKCAVFFFVFCLQNWTKGFSLSLSPYFFISLSLSHESARSLNQWLHHSIALVLVRSLVRSLARSCACHRAHLHAPACARYCARSLTQTKVRSFFLLSRTKGFSLSHSSYIFISLSLSHESARSLNRWLHHSIALELTRLLVGSLAWSLVRSQKMKCAFSLVRSFTRSLVRSLACFLLRLPLHSSSVLGARSCARYCARSWFITDSIAW